MQQFSPLKAAGLQLAPGFANLVVFTIFALWFESIGIPPLLALAATILVAEVPLSWWIMRRVTRSETGGAFDLNVTFPWRAAIPWWQYLVIGLPLIVFGMIVIGAVTPAISSLIRSTLELNIPAWFLLEPDPATRSRHVCRHESADADHDVALKPDYFCRHRWYHPGTLCAGFPVAQNADAWSSGTFIQCSDFRDFPSQRTLELAWICDIGAALGLPDLVEAIGEVRTRGSRRNAAHADTLDGDNRFWTGVT
jgi:hypothetical protein